MPTTFSPREAARISGFSAETVRYYERIGLLPPVRRTSAGRRVFSELDLQWLGLLRCQRDTGMPITEMQAFVGLMQSGAGTRPERLGVLEAHARRVEEQIGRLQLHLGQINGKIGQYRRGEVWNP